MTTCCAAGPCDRYLATGGQRESERRDACGVCFQHDQPQPETLLEKRRRQQATGRALGVTRKELSQASDRYGNGLGTVAAHHPDTC